MGIETVNPTTGKIIQSYPEMSGEEVVQVIEKTHHAFDQWKSTSFSDRSKCMKNTAEILRNKNQELAHMMVKEMGKPIKQAEAEIEKCSWVCEYYADHAQRFLAEEFIEIEGAKSYVKFQPLGTVLAIMPWNFPFWQVFRFLAPGLMAGNAVILKHASNVTGCALAIEKTIEQAGFPEDLFHILMISPQKVAEVIENPRIKAVTLTGSTLAGRAVASKAGECLKKTVLELGGSDPYIILPDADLEEAAKICVASRMINGGQSCIAAKRFIVLEAIKNKFEELIIQYMRAYLMGDPMDPITTLGPLAKFDLRDQLHTQVEKSLAQGAQLLFGGYIPDRAGAFYPPTILTDVRKGMPAYEEELFGPVISVISVSKEKEAIEAANQSSFGLGAAVFTKNIKWGEEIAANQLEAGSCFVNAFVKSDPRLPFGGIKESGYGRELSSFGIQEFVNIKTVYIKS
jgi:succinate-semialdehyde dehydrogenase/glutarate-semialdehyde dehydrogenase